MWRHSNMTWYFDHLRTSSILLEHLDLLKSISSDHFWILLPFHVKMRRIFHAKQVICYNQYLRSRCHVYIGLGQRSLSWSLLAKKLFESLLLFWIDDALRHRNSPIGLNTYLLIPSIILKLKIEALENPLWKLTAN